MPNTGKIEDWDVENSTSNQGKMIKIKAAWDVKDWYIQDSTIFIVRDGVTVAFDLKAAVLADQPKPNEPLTIILEIPCPMFPIQPSKG